MIFNAKGSTPFLVTNLNTNKMRREFIVTMPEIGVLRVDTYTNNIGDELIEAVWDSEMEDIYDYLKVSQLDEIFNMINNGDAHEINNGSISIQSKINQIDLGDGQMYKEDLDRIKQSTKQANL